MAPRIARNDSYWVADRRRPAARPALSLKPETLEHPVHDSGVGRGALGIREGTRRQRFLSSEQLIGLHGPTVRRGQYSDNAGSVRAPGGYAEAGVGVGSRSAAPVLCADLMSGFRRAGRLLPGCGQATAGKLALGGSR